MARVVKHEKLRKKQKTFSMSDETFGYLDKLSYRLGLNMSATLEYLIKKAIREKEGVINE